MGAVFRYQAQEEWLVVAHSLPTDTYHKCMEIAGWKISSICLLYNLIQACVGNTGIRKDDFKAELLTIPTMIFTFCLFVYK